MCWLFFDNLWRNMTLFLYMHMCSSRFSHESCVVVCWSAKRLVIMHGIVLQISGAICQKKKWGCKVDCGLVQQPPVIMVLSNDSPLLSTTAWSNGTVGTGARCAHGVHRLGQLHSFHPPIGPSQKGTPQKHWHPENSQEMGIITPQNIPQKQEDICENGMH